MRKERKRRGDSGWCPDYFIVIGENEPVTVDEIVAFAKEAGAVSWDKDGNQEFWIQFQQKPVVREIPPHADEICAAEKASRLLLEKAIKNAAKNGRELSEEEIATFERPRVAQETDTFVAKEFPARYTEDVLIAMYPPRLRDGRSA